MTFSWMEIWRLDSQKTTVHKAIDRLIAETKKDQNHPFDLLPYFYPRFTKSKKDRHIFEIPSYAYIANAGFDQVPAVYKNKTSFLKNSEKRILFLTLLQSSD